MHEKEMLELKMMEMEKKSKTKEEKRKYVEIANMSKRALETHKYNLCYPLHTQKKHSKVVQLPTDRRLKVKKRRINCSLPQIQ